MKQYIIHESQLLRLLASRAKLNALEWGGVDNWSMYGYSINKYLTEWILENRLPIDEDYDFEDVAKSQLHNYEIYHSDKTE